MNYIGNFLLSITLVIFPLNSISKNLDNIKSPPSLESEFSCSRQTLSFCFKDIEYFSDSNIALLKWHFETNDELMSDKNKELAIVRLSEALLSSFDLQAAKLSGLEKNLRYLLNNKSKKLKIVIGVESKINNKDYTSITKIENNNEFNTEIFEGEKSIRDILFK
ncbi:hypothetical protein [Enterovibrio norvegicus]|uniref:hypothetical protein n=1 Tax=Enterovibrio norvegicus TaxID=188144 RepID=UPI0024B194C0|nr:hypothetical protein [Enterovibrio norvegicus]